MTSSSLSQYIASTVNTKTDSKMQAYLQAVCEEYRRRSDAYSLITQINQIIKTVQKHRGYTIGLLSGDESYRERFEQLQTALQKRLHVLEIYGQYTGGLITENDKSNLNFCWQTIANNWQEDNINESLELHSHFVEVLLSLKNTISTDLSQGILDSLDDEYLPSGIKDVMANYPKTLPKLEVLDFTGRFLPENIEVIGKLRALSTHMATTPNNSDSDLRKLRFLVETLRDNIAKLRVTANRLTELCQKDYPALKLITQTEIHLELLLSLIENSILSGASTNQSDGRQLFIKATFIIDQYWTVVNKGFEMMQQWHDAEFDYWLANN